MKVRSLFALVEDAQDVCEHFERVDTPEQMVSALERLKKQGAAQLLADVASLRLAVEALLEDMFEVGSSPIEGEDNEEIPEDLLDGLGEEEAATEDAPDAEAPPKEAAGGKP